MAFGTARRAFLPAGVRWRGFPEVTTSVRDWGRVLATALGVGAVAGAGQLGVAYGLGLLRLEREFASDGLWSTQLTWVAWCAALAGLAGAAAGSAFARRSGRQLALSGRIGAAATAGLGGLVVAPLTALPASGAELAGRPAASPALEAALTAGLGALVGVVAAVIVLSVRLAAVSVTVLVSAVWLLALLSAAPSLPASADLPEARVAVLDLAAFGGARDVIAVLSPPVLALLICGGLAAAARARDLPPLQTAAATSAAPGLLALAYLIGSPGPDGGDVQTSPYAGALVGVAAGLLTALLVGVVRLPGRGPEESLPASGPPEPPPAGGPAGPDHPVPVAGAAAPAGVADPDPVGDAGSHGTGAVTEAATTDPGMPNPRPPSDWPPQAAGPRRRPNVEPPDWAARSAADTGPETVPAPEPAAGPPVPEPSQVREATAAGAAATDPTPPPAPATAEATATETAAQPATAGQSAPPEPAAAVTPPVPQRRKRRWLPGRQRRSPERPATDPVVDGSAPGPDRLTAGPAADVAAGAEPEERPDDLALPDPPAAPRPDRPAPQRSAAASEPGAPAGGGVDHPGPSAPPTGPGSAAPDSPDSPDPQDPQDPQDSPRDEEPEPDRPEQADEPSQPVKRRRQQADEEQHIDWISSLAGAEDAPEPPAARRRLRKDHDD